MNFLFWNTYKNENINSILSDIIIEHNASIVILAEYIAKMDELIELLYHTGIKMEEYNTCCERIKLLGTLKDVELKLDTERYTIQIIGRNIILCCVHLNSKLYTGNEQYREIIIEQIVHDVQSIEEEIGSENSIIVGDFNLNPYDASCIDARFFHSLPVYKETTRKKRKIAGKNYSMFYNPMWNLLGDFKEPYGTYYYNSGGTQNTYWNLFDQVIIRPSLRENFVDNSLCIISETSERYLLDSEGHPKKEISDHLPIYFEIKEDT